MSRHHSSQRSVSQSNGRRAAAVAAAVALLIAVPLAAMSGGPAVTTTDAPTAKGAAAGDEGAPEGGLSKAEARAAYGALPVHFEPNQGQHADAVAFSARAGGVALFLTDAGATMALDGGHAVAMTFEGATGPTAITGEDRLPGHSNYLQGDDPAQWVTEVPHYAKVRYADVWPGIDVVFRDSGDGALEYDVIVAPGADPSDARLAVGGADAVEVTETGELAIRTPVGDLTQSAPVTYQVVDGERVAVDSAFKLRDGDTVGFEVGDHDAARTLVIDPELGYSTFVGGTGADEGLAIAVDAAGNAYVTGVTEAEATPPFPTTPGAFQTEPDDDDDAFVFKLSPDGSTLVYSTFLAGTQDDTGRGITVDAAGNAYVTGETFSPDFPTTTGAHDTSLNGVSDAFVTKLDPTGSALGYSTLLGGSEDDEGWDVAVDGAGNAFVIGETESSNFPTTTGAYDTSFNNPGTSVDDLFVTKLNPAGAGLVYSTLVGGNDDDEDPSIAIDAAGNAYGAGEVESSNFPTTAGAYDTSFAGGADDVAVFKLNTAGSNLVYSTFLGGDDDEDMDFSGMLAVDGAGHAYVTSETDSADFPTTPGAYQATYNGGGTNDQATVTKLSVDGSSLEYSTFFGGSDDTEATGIRVDDDGRATIVGEVDGDDLPVTPDAVQSDFGGGGDDAFVARFNAAGSALLFSTYLGGSDDEEGQGIALDGAGSAYLTGNTDSEDFPTTPGANDTSFNGVDDVFVAKIDFAQLQATKEDAPDPVGVGGNLTYFVNITNRGEEIALNTTLVDELPPSAEFEGAQVEYSGAFPGYCDYHAAEHEVHCDLGAIPQGSWANVTIWVTPTEAGVITNVATVNATNAEAVRVTEDTTVVGEAADITLTCTAREEGNFLDWTAVAGADEYRILRAVEGGSLSQYTTVTDTDLLDSDVDAGTTYRYQVQAVDNGQVVATSDACEVTAIPFFGPGNAALVGALALAGAVGAYAWMRRRP